MSALVMSVVAGATGGAVVAASREAARHMRWRVGRLSHRRKHRSTHGPAAPSATVHSSDARAAYRAAQVRAYADHLARGDARLREQLCRFEKPISGSEHQSGDVPW